MMFTLDWNFKTLELKSCADNANSGHNSEILKCILKENSVQFLFFFYKLDTH